MTSIRVLFADPDEFLLTAYRELRRHDFDVATASNALKCIRRMRQIVPDVLILEPQLPWSGGDGVLSIMRDEPSLADIPVMILTACRDPHILKSVAPFPISDYRVKPLAPADLVTRIRRLLDHVRRCALELDVSHRLERWDACHPRETLKTRPLIVAEMLRAATITAADFWYAPTPSASNPIIRLVAPRSFWTHANHVRPLRNRTHPPHHRHSSHRPWSRVESCAQPAPLRKSPGVATLARPLIWINTPPSSERRFATGDSIPDNPKRPS